MTINSQSRDKKYLPAKPVRERYGVSDMTIHRWLNDPRMGFPKPVYLGRYRYWEQSHLEAWEHSRDRRCGSASEHGAASA